VRLFFEREPSRRDELFVSVDGDHGRIETRRCRVSHDVASLSTGRRFPDEPRFPALAAIGMIEAEVERAGRTSTSRGYDLSSASLSAEQFALAARAHWGVENRLHWTLDVVFHDDLMRLRSQNGPANMGVIKHLILNLIKDIPDKASLKTRRKTLAWDDTTSPTLSSSHGDETSQATPLELCPPIGVAPWGGHSGPWGRAFEEGSPWLGTARTALSLNARSLRSSWPARPSMGSPSGTISAGT